jgi:hypothetical protein
VGEFLRERLTGTRARLEVIRGGAHDFAVAQADLVASLVGAHLAG